MGIFLQKGWVPQLVISGTSTTLDIHYAKWLKFDIGDTRVIEAEMPLNGNRDFKVLGDHAEFVIRNHIYKYDSIAGYGYTAQSWHDTFINNFYKKKIYLKTHTGNYNIKGADGSTMEFMPVAVEIGIIQESENMETYMDITIKSLEYIDQTQISVDVP